MERSGVKNANYNWEVVFKPKIFIFFNRKKIVSRSKLVQKEGDEKFSRKSMGFPKKKKKNSWYKLSEYCGNTEFFGLYKPS